MRLSTIVLCCLAITSTSSAYADPRWEHLPQDVREWFARQKQHDQPLTGCCGLGDAYYADEFAREGDKFYAIITDDRDDNLLGRPSRPSGMRFWVPPNKFNDPSPQGTKDPVPVPHGIVFIDINGNVICYFNPPTDG